MDVVNMDVVEVTSNNESSASNRQSNTGVISFEELAKIYDSAKKEPNFFMSLQDLYKSCTNSKQRDRIKRADWNPLSMRGTEFCGAFIKFVFPMCHLLSSKADSIFEASAISESGVIRKVIDKVFYYSGYKNNRIFLKLQHDSGDDDDGYDAGLQPNEEDAVFPWYAWVHQSLKIPPEGTDIIAFGIHDFTCWLLIAMCKTAKQLDPSGGTFGLSDVPAFVVLGAERFINNDDSRRLRAPLLTEISPFLPKIIDIPEHAASNEKPSENRMQTRASTSKTPNSTKRLAKVDVDEGRLDIKPSLRVAVVYVEETGEDAVQIDLTSNDDEISYLAELKAVLEREDFTMRQKETAMDQIINRAKENIRLQKSKVGEMEKEYDAMTLVYGPVREQMEKDEASERLCKETVASFDKIGKANVEVDKVHVFFKSCNLVLEQRGLKPGTKAVIKRKPAPTCLETGQGTEGEKENMDNVSSSTAAE